MRGTQRPPGYRDPRLNDSGVTPDGIRWELSRDGIRLYIGECGGCGTHYRSTGEADAAWGVCTRCDSYGSGTTY